MPPDRYARRVPGEGPPSCRHHPTRHRVNPVPYQINSICPKGALEINLGKLTVLVGPNNCGKSQTLKDIREFTSSGSLDRLVVLDGVGVSLPDETELRAGVQIRPHENTADHINVIGVKDDLLSQVSFGPSKSWFEDVFNGDMDRSRQQREILRSLGTCLIAYLGAEARFKLTQSSAAFNPRSEAPSNAIQSLYAAEPTVLAELRQAFKAAFDMDIGLDWAALTQFYLRVSEDFGAIPDTRAELDALMSDADDLQGQGDGFRSFTGIALALLTYPSRIILLDEPEAFLHPAQARVLGDWVARRASLRSAQVIVATHSSDFLAGLVGAGKEAKIMRLSRAEMTTRFRVIAPEITTGLVESPLLSSQPVLDSMFHRGVVICEGDPDRAVYQTVAQRFVENRIGADFLFIHSNGKDAAKIPAQLLRETGTPVCVVVDFDAMNSEKTLEEIAKSLTGVGLGEDEKALRDVVAAAIEAKSEKQSLDDLKTSVAAWIEQVGSDDLRKARKNLVAYARAGSNKWDHAKKVGIKALPDAEQPVALDLIERLSSRGIFVVPCGELESWMGLGVSKGNSWNQLALQRLHEGDCPPPLTEFVERILKFLV